MEDTNRVHIIGTIIENFQYSHISYGERFYSTTIQIKRLSGVCDNICLTVSERLVDVNADWANCRVEVDGQFRSFNKDTDYGKRKCMLFVFATELHPTGEEKDVNQIFLDGYICKRPVFRETPLGREITDMVIAVNRNYGKSDYLPVICWSRNARYASQLEIGDHITFEGRIQSREYIKKLSETTAETRTAYEVSVATMEVIEESGGNYEDY